MLKYCAEPLKNTPFDENVGEFTPDALVLLPDLSYHVETIAPLFGTTPVLSGSAPSYQSRKPEISGVIDEDVDPPEFIAVTTTA